MPKYAKTGATILNTWVRIETTARPDMPLAVCTNNNCDFAISATTPDANTQLFFSPGTTGAPDHVWYLETRPDYLWFRDLIGASTASIISRY